MRPQPRTVQDEWAQRIRSETVINLIALGRDDEALARLDDWLADLPKLYAPWLYRADLRRRRDGAAAALTDYVQTATAAAAEISSSVSGRFRRFDRERLDSVFHAALSGVVAARRADLTFGILELANSGAAMAARLSGDDEEKRRSWSRQRSICGRKRKRWPRSRQRRSSVAGPTSSGRSTTARTGSLRAAIF